MSIIFTVIFENNIAVLNGCTSVNQGEFYKFHFHSHVSILFQLTHKTKWVIPTVKSSFCITNNNVKNCKFDVKSTQRPVSHKSFCNPVAKTRVAKKNSSTLNLTPAAHLITLQLSKSYTACF